MRLTIRNNAVGCTRQVKNDDEDLWQFIRMRRNNSRISFYIIKNKNNKKLSTRITSNAGRRFTLVPENSPIDVYQRFYFYLIGFCQFYMKMANGVRMAMSPRGCSFGFYSNNYDQIFYLSPE